MPEVVKMKFRRLLQVLLVQPTSKAQGEASVVAMPFFSTVEVEVGVHRKVRVHSCDDIISSDLSEREPNGPFSADVTSCVLINQHCCTALIFT